jgi:hypothetical protein
LQQKPRQKVKDHPAGDIDPAARVPVRRLWSGVANLPKSRHFGKVAATDPGNVHFTDNPVFRVFEANSATAMNDQPKRRRDYRVRRRSFSSTFTNRGK